MTRVVLAFDQIKKANAGTFRGEYWYLSKSIIELKKFNGVKNIFTEKFR